MYVLEFLDKNAYAVMGRNVTWQFNVFADQQITLLSERGVCSRYWLEVDDDWLQILKYNMYYFDVA